MKNNETPLYFNVLNVNIDYPIFYKYELFPDQLKKMYFYFEKLNDSRLMRFNSEFFLTVQRLYFK